MNIIKPQALKKGDTIGILATSGAVESEEKILYAKKYFENLGYKIKLSNNILHKYRYLAGTDEEKIEELHKFFKDPKINAIICLRGGYGAIRLIKNIDYNLIKENPKIFCGYSDITALSLMFLKKSNLLTYSGPMIQSDFGFENPDQYTTKAFFDAVTGKNIEYNIEYSGSNVSGMLWGGNLSTIVSLCGQDFIPDEDFIFFAEDLNEPVYKIDKMITQLCNINEFKNHIKAFVLGDFLDIDNKAWLDELFIELSKKYNIPLAKGLKATHLTKKATIPIGANATLKKNCLIIK